MDQLPAGQSDFGGLLRRTREKAGLSRQELGGRVGLDASHIFRIETGDRRPSRESALALADALGLDDQSINEWLLAAGFAPMPLLTALRTAVRTRGTVRTRSAGVAAPSHWDPAVWARRLESIGLRESAVERLMTALGNARLAEQESAARGLA